MTGIFKANYSVLRDWKTTLTVAFQQLRRIPFIIEDTFQFGDFDPQTNFNGMTISNYVLYGARYLKIKNLLWFHYDMTVTLAAPLAASIKIIIPGTASTEYGIQSGYAQIDNAVTGESDGWYLLPGTNEIVIFRTGVVNYTAVATRIKLNGWVEVV